jgi:hypothetical protein
LVIDLSLVRESVSQLLDFLVVHVNVVRPHLSNVATNGPFGRGEPRWNDINRETELLEENLSQFHFCATNLTWIDLEAYPGLQDVRPAANRLSHGTTSLGLLVN